MRSIGLLVSTSLLLLFVFASSVAAQASGTLSNDEISGSALGPSDRSVVVLIHGWTKNKLKDPPESQNSYAEGDWARLVDVLTARLTGTGTKLLLYHWENDASTGGTFEISPWLNPFILFYPSAFSNASSAAANAFANGPRLADSLNTSAPDLRRVTFIAHSAGAWAAYRAADKLLQSNPFVVVEVVLLDPFIPGADPDTITPLTTSRMGLLASHASQDRIYRLENYFADDWTDQFGKDSTSQTFSWRQRDINQRIDYSFVQVLPQGPELVQYYGPDDSSGDSTGHKAPIRFYADSVVATLPGRSLPSALFYAPWSYETIGYFRGLVYEESLLPAITAQPQAPAQPATVGSTVPLSVSANRATSYQWFKDGQIRVGAVSSTLTISSVSVTDAGTYVVRVGNGDGYTFSEKTELRVGTPGPTVTTNAASGLTATEATLNATVNPNGTSTTLYFDYGLTAGYGTTKTVGVIGSGTSPLTRAYNLSGLNCGATYQYRARAQNSGGSTSGANQAFTTSACGQPGTELLTNGSFASGSSGWTLSGSFFADARFPNCRSCPGYAYLANADGTPGNSLVGTLDQTIAVPASATSATLTFWYSITTQETSPSVAFDVMNVTIQNASGAVLKTVAVLSNLDHSNGYMSVSASLTEYAGQTIRLHFVGTTDGSLPTVFRIDDASVQVSAAAGGGLPGLFTKSSPADSTIGHPTSPTLSWGTSTGATSYEYCLETSINSNCEGSWTNVGNTTSVVVFGLAGNTAYQWEVRARNASGTTNADGGGWWIFTTQLGLPGTFNKTAPGQGASLPSTGVTLSWQPSAGATLYEYCVDRINNNTCDDQWYTTGLTLEMLNLAPGSVYYWQVRARNGTGTTEANGGTWSSFTTQLPNGIYFSDDFEACGCSWSPDSPWAVTTEASRSGTHAWSDSPGGHYGPNLNVSLRLPGIDLRTAVRPELRFWQRRDFAADGYDAGNVWVTTDNGQTFKFLRAFSLTDATWTQAIIDLTPYVGFQSVGLVFQVLSNASTSGDGWYIDDVLVKEATIPPGFNKTSPSNGLAGALINTSLSWFANPDAASYEYCVDTTNNSSCDTAWTSAGSATGVIPNGLIAGATYWWEVRAKNGAGVTLADGGVWWSFTTAGGLPGSFSKTGPLQGASLQGIGATLTWQPSTGATQYQYCIDSIDNNLCDAQWYTTGLTLEILNLAPGVAYHWQVRAQNGAGTTEANGGWWTFTTIQLPSGTYFSNDFETCGCNWFADSPWALTTEASHSGTHAWTDSPGGNYGPNLNVSLRLPTIDLRTASRPELRFWQRRDFAADGYDAGNVWVTTDYGTTFTFLRKFTLTDTTWTQAIVDLTPFVGNQSVGVVFQVLSNGSASSDGWYIDDVVIQEAPVPSTFGKSAPGNGASGQSTSPTLAWQASANATSYEYCYDTLNNNVCDGNWVSAGASASAIAAGLAPSTTYYWQVRAINSVGTTYANGGIGAFWSFVTAGGAQTRVISLSGSLLFADVLVGSTATRTFTISNTGNTALTVSGISYPTGFTGAWAGTIPPGGSQDVVVSFTPASTANYSGVVTVNSNATAGVATIATTAIGIAPTIVTADSVTPASGTGATQTFALQYSSTSGAASITTAWVWFNATFANTAVNSCLAYYDRATNVLRLLDDAGAWMPATLGTATTLENSQCAVTVGSSTVVLAGNTLTLNLAMTFKPAYNGAKNVYLSANAGAVTSGWQDRGDWTVPSGGAPGVATVTADSVTPASGTGATQTFALQYSSTTGAASITTAWVWFNATFANTAVNSCLAYYDRATNVLRLLDDAGAWMPATLGTATTLENSQCAVTVGSSTVVLAGNTLTLNLAMTFKPAYNGAKNVYVSASAGAVTSGWQDRGDWTVPSGGGGGGGAPTITTDSVTPASGTGATQAFALQYTHSQGAANISAAWVWFNATFANTAVNSCLAYYDRATNVLRLLDDAGAWMPATLGTATTLENSQCAVTVGSSTVVLAGNTLTLNLAMTFKPAYNGAKNVYVSASAGAVTSGWQDRGDWTVPSGGAGGGGAPTITTDSVTPASGTGATQAFALQYTHSQGAANISAAWVWFNATFANTAVNSCLAYYDRATNVLRLLDDAGVWMPATLGTATTLENSQCAVTVGNSTVVLAGNTLTLNLAMTFKPAYNGAKNVYLFASAGAATSGWQDRGDWTVPSGGAGGGGAQTITADSVTPASGTGATQTFALQYTNTQGAANISAAWVWFNATFANTAVNSCLAYYDRATNVLRLLDDAGVWMPATLGTATTLENSQCAVTVGNSTVVLAGNTLTLNLAMTFKPAYNGAKNVYVSASAGAVTSGWQDRGDWTVP